MTYLRAGRRELIASYAGNIRDFAWILEFHLHLVIEGASQYGARVSVGTGADRDEAVAVGPDSGGIDRAGARGTRTRTLDIRVPLPPG